MNTVELTAELGRLGVRLSHSNGILHVDAPEGVLTEAVRHELAERKAEILAILRRSESAKAIRLVRERGYVPIQSASLDGEVVLLVRDESVQIPKRWQDAVTYTLAELTELRKAESDALRRIHDCKRVFRGRIMETVIDTMETTPKAVGSTPTNSNHRASGADNGR